MTPPIDIGFTLPDAVALHEMAQELIKYAEAADVDPEAIEQVKARVRRQVEAETGAVST